MYDRLFSISLKKYNGQIVIISLCEASLFISFVRCSCAYSGDTLVQRLCVFLEDLILVFLKLHFKYFNDSLHYSLPNSREYCC